MFKIFEPIASVFNGKGGTLKLTITLSMLAAFFYELSENGYRLKGQSKDGHISLGPNTDKVPISSPPEQDISSVQGGETQQIQESYA